MVSKEIEFAQLLWQVRRLFQRMATESNDLLAGFGITAGQRAVLEFLDHQEPETLANMARAHDVSRQNIQQMVNELLEKKLVETVDNPRHKRSFLVRQSGAGRALFGEIKRIETELFRKVVKQFSSAQIKTSLETLSSFNKFLQSQQWLLIKQHYLEKGK